MLSSIEGLHTSRSGVGGKKERDSEKKSATKSPLSILYDFLNLWNVGVCQHEIMCCILFYPCTYQ